VGSKQEHEASSPHYQVHVRDDQQDYRLAINVKSVQAPFDLLYFVDDNFKHPITEGLDKLGFGFHQLPNKPGDLALDYIRGNLFEVTKMKPLPFNVPGPDNDLNEIIDLFIQRAINSKDAVLYAFGETWGPQTKEDKIFHFHPGNGIHDIHMNQGSSGKFKQITVFGRMVGYSCTSRHGISGLLRSLPSSRSRSIPMTVLVIHCH
jgi:uncharacterized protein YukJ